MSLALSVSDRGFTSQQQQSVGKRHTHLGITHVYSLSVRCLIKVAIPHHSLLFQAINVVLIVFVDCLQTISTDSAARCLIVYIKLIL